MEQSAKFFPKTLKALKELNQSAEELKIISNNAVVTNQKLSQNLFLINQQIKDKIEKVETIINTLEKSVEDK